MRASLVWMLVALTAPALAEEQTTYWDFSKPGSISHDFAGDQAPVVLCMQGRRVVMECHVDKDKGLDYQVRFLGLQGPEHKTRLLFRGGVATRPKFEYAGRLREWWKPQRVSFDGRLHIHYAPYRGVSATRMIYPSTTSALVIEEWTLRNDTEKPIAIKAASASTKSVLDDRLETTWQSPGMEQVVQPGEALTLHGVLQARRLSDSSAVADVAVERDARMAVAKAAWNGPGRLEVPDPMLVAAYNLQKLHVLETPADTYRGVMAHNGSLTYSPGVWANDPVEYSSPLFPFFGDAQLNESSMNMYRLWLDHCREHGIDPFPGSFEYERLQLVQKHRGDNAMVLYGLSKFLLFQGERKAAEELWPLIEFAVTSIKQHMTPQGIVASRTDEMEGRYPTGDANLSTSALAYGGYIHAAHLARALDKPEVAKAYEAAAAKLAAAIESYFGATVEGFDTYRYFEGNDILRGWILLPLAMGIDTRQEATVDALLSDKLWPNKTGGGDLLAASNRETEWGRETYYALRVLYQAGRTEKAHELTRNVARAQIFGARGPYPDEDAIDMLCPGSLYPRVFTEGVFGISPTGLDSFECTPRLPKAWPQMALRDLRAFGTSWDIVVERDGQQQKVTVTSGGKTLLEDSGPAGKTYQVKLPR